MNYENTDWVSHQTAMKAWRRCRPQLGDLLLVCVGATTGRVCVLREPKDMVLVRSVALIRPSSLVSPDFLLIAMRSPACQGQIWQKVKVAAQPCLYINRIESLAIPLAPLGEQDRIVAKVGELMALCDELEAVQAKREKRRDRLVAATLHDLNNGEANTEPGNRVSGAETARFYFNHLPRLTTRPEHIHQLRQTILNLSVRGKLVPQDPTDEPADALLRRIAIEKRRLVESSELRRETPLRDDQRFSFKLPVGWEWSRIRDLFLAASDGDHQPPPKAEQGVPFLVIGNIRKGSLDFTGCRYVPDSYYYSLDPIRRPARQDILYTLVGSFGMAVLVKDDRPFCVQRHIGILRTSREVHAKFFALALQSAVVFEQAAKCATGIAQKTVPLGGLRRIMVPVPPFREQQRIATRVDELMAICDELETQLTRAATTRRSLLEATLREALAPTQATAARTSGSSA